MPGGASTAIVGEPGTGKTSLLDYLASPEARDALLAGDREHVIVSYLDAHTFDHGLDHADFWALAVDPLDALDGPLPPTAQPGPGSACCVKAASRPGTSVPFLSSLCRPPPPRPPHRRARLPRPALRTKPSPLLRQPPLDHHPLARRARPRRRQPPSSRLPRRRGPGRRPHRLRPFSTSSPRRSPSPGARTKMPPLARADRRFSPEDEQLVPRPLRRSSLPRPAPRRRPLAGSRRRRARPRRAPRRGSGDRGARSFARARRHLEAVVPPPSATWWRRLPPRRARASPTSPASRTSSRRCRPRVSWCARGRRFVSGRGSSGRGASEKIAQRCRAADTWQALVGHGGVRCRCHARSRKRGSKRCGPRSPAPTRSRARLRACRRGLLCAGASSSSSRTRPRTTGTATTSTSPPSSARATSTSGTTPGSHPATTGGPGLVKRSASPTSSCCSSAPTSSHRTSADVEMAHAVERRRGPRA